MGRTKIGRIKLTCRITPKAMDRLKDKVVYCRAKKPPYGEIVSRLISLCPPRLTEALGRSAKGDTKVPGSSIAKAKPPSPICCSMRQQKLSIRRRRAHQLAWSPVHTPDVLVCVEREHSPAPRLQHSNHEVRFQIARHVSLSRIVD